MGCCYRDVEKQVIGLVLFGTQPFVGLFALGALRQKTVRIIDPRNMELDVAHRDPSCFAVAVEKSGCMLSPQA